MSTKDLLTVPARPALSVYLSGGEVHISQSSGYDGATVGLNEREAHAVLAALQAAVAELSGRKSEVAK